MTPATSTAGSISAFIDAPWNKSAKSQPNRAKRATPTAAARIPTTTPSATRPRTPLVNAHNRLSKYIG